MSIIARFFFYLLAAFIVCAAIFNFRLGFGAQDHDCIDASVFLTRYKRPDLISRGDYLAFIGEKMGQPFDGHIIIKKVGAVSGDTIVIADSKLFINGEFIAPLDIEEKAANKLGVEVKSFEREQVVPEGSLFMIGTKPRTYDSRYWGFVSTKNVVGKMYPLI